MTNEKSPRVYEGFIGEAPIVLENEENRSIYPVSPEEKEAEYEDFMDAVMSGDFELAEEIMGDRDIFDII